MPVLRELEQDFPKISIFEGPIKADDLPGNRLLREKIRTPIAHHYGTIPPRSAIQEGYCDGFVMAGGVSKIVHGGAASATANMPFFLQMVGTGLTTTMALHLGAALSHAQWPAITCHELYVHPLLEKRIDVLGGYAQAPDEPGLGVMVDEAALEKYRVDKADFTLPPRLIRYHRSCGIDVYFADDSHNTSPMWAYFANGSQPLYERGVSTTLIDDDGSVEFADLHESAVKAPVLMRSN